MAAVFKGATSVLKSQTYTKDSYGIIEYEATYLCKPGHVPTYAVNTDVTPTVGSVLLPTLKWYSIGPVTTAANGPWVSYQAKASNKFDATFPGLWNLDWEMEQFPFGFPVLLVPSAPYPLTVDHWDFWLPRVTARTFHLTPPLTSSYPSIATPAGAPTGFVIPTGPTITNYGWMLTQDSINSGEFYERTRVWQYRNKEITGISGTKTTYP